MNANAEIILIKSDGSIILQQRDDKPNITNPGYVSSFGGAIEEGESPHQAAYRELYEETSLRPPFESLKFFKQYTKSIDIHGEDREIYYFLLKDVSEEDFRVYEGQGYVVLKSENQMNTYKITIMLQQALHDYYASLLQIRDWLGIIEYS